MGLALKVRPHVPWTTIHSLFFKYIIRHLQLHRISPLHYLCHLRWAHFQSLLEVAHLRAWISGGEGGQLVSLVSKPRDVDSDLDSRNHQLIRPSRFSTVEAILLAC